jgi:8-oxo-dGTP diphosphatase
VKPLNNAVSLVIKDDKDRFLVVKRPNNPNDELGGVWGFPAVTLKEGESEAEGCKRIGDTKLGVEIKLGNRIGDGEDERKKYNLHLADYEARIINGVPKVPQPDTSVTQYEECQFTNDPKLLYPAAQKGSVCTQVFLKSIGADWSK